MKTLKDLFELVAIAVERNSRYEHFFVDYSGHVNTIRIQYYLGGWNKESQGDRLEVKLDEDGIQAAFWFLKTKLDKGL